jgi:hypothetical protein
MSDAGWLFSRQATDVVRGEHPAHAPLRTSGGSTRRPATTHRSANDLPPSSWLDDLAVEKLEMVLDQAGRDATGLRCGEHVSGPSAVQYRARVARAATFAGLTVTGSATPRGCSRPAGEVARLEIPPELPELCATAATYLSRREPLAQQLIEVTGLSTVFWVSAWSGFGGKLQHPDRARKKHHAPRRPGRSPADRRHGILPASQQLTRGYECADPASPGRWPLLLAW